MARRQVPIEDAVGTVLAHDLTRVVPGAFKGVQFHAGHRIGQEDLELLRSMGKEHVWVLDLEPGEVHENLAATRTAAALAGPGIVPKPAEEGKVNLVAVHDGLFLVDVERVQALNERGEIAVVTKAPETRVRAQERVAAVKVIPLAVAEDEVAAREAAGPLLEVRPFRALAVRMVTTGREVWSGRVQDAFRPAVEPKLRAVGATLLSQTIVPDEVGEIRAAIARALQDADLVLVTGGMSVDPDDVTPKAIAEAGVDVAVRGTPVLPGSMFLLGYAGERAVMGLPACVIHDPVTIFDVMLPKVAAGLRPTWRDVARMGVGGLLETCPTCHTSPLTL
jgi:molybdenum cofactor synthesis domain-containing protein